MMIAVESNCVSLQIPSLRFCKCLSAVTMIFMSSYIGESLDRVHFLAYTRLNSQRPVNSQATLLSPQRPEYLLRLVAFKNAV